ncbi:MAG: hypothetical protein ACLFNU_00785, partial [Bacteroidales bacterium]
QLCSISQRYNLKAIHNEKDKTMEKIEAVFNKSNLPDWVVQAGIQSEPSVLCELAGGKAIHNNVKIIFRPNAIQSHAETILSYI